MRKLLIMLVFTIITLAACSENNAEDTEKAEDRVTTVEVGEVTEGNLNTVRTFYGRTMPNQTIPIMVQMAGEVTELEVSNGDEVEEGDSIATIQTQQGNIPVEATADGTIAQLTAKEGSIASNQEPLATIVDLDTLTVQLQVPDVQVDLFKEGEEVTVRMQNNEEETYQATVENTAQMAGETGLFAIELSIDNESANLKAGAVATIEVTETVVKETTLIPTSALVETNDETFVYVVEDNKAKKVEVTVKSTQSTHTAIEAELEKGAQVITNGQLTLSDGSKIEIAEEE